MINGFTTWQRQKLAEKRYFIKCPISGEAKNSEIECI